MLTNGGCGAYNHDGRAVSLAGLTAPPSWLQSRKALAVKQRSSYSWEAKVIPTWLKTKRNLLIPQVAYCKSKKKRECHCE